MSESSATADFEPTVEQQLAHSGSVLMNLPSWLKARTANQENSRLLRLPQELRDIIIDYATEPDVPTSDDILRFRKQALPSLLHASYELRENTAKVYNSKVSPMIVIESAVARYNKSTFQDLSEFGYVHLMRCNKIFLYHATQYKTKDSGRAAARELEERYMLRENTAYVYWYRGDKWVNAEGREEEADL